MRRFVSKLVLGLAVVALVSPAVRADITTSGNFKTGSPTPTLNITAPITLPITASGNLNYLDISNWVTNDGTQDNTSASPSGQKLSYQINGGAIQTIGVSYLYDNDQSFGAATVNDGLLNFSSILAVTTGQTLTILPGTFTFASGGSTFNQPPADFTGNVFVASTSAARLSPSVSVGAVPEPATLGVIGIPAALALLRRRRMAV